MIYADNAATTILDTDALAAMMPYLQSEYANASEPYSFARSAKTALRASKEAIAACINADPAEIFFTSGGTESDNWALKGVMYEYGDNRALITSQIEHHAILNSAAAIERMGYPVVYLPVNSDAVVLPDALSRVITDSTKLVSVMFSNNEVGTVQPIKELAGIAHQHGALFHTDAVQALGHISIDVKALDIDMLSASAHKFNGPKGVGFLYIKKGTPIHPFNNGGAQEFGLRAGTENVAAIVGMAKALEKNCAEIPEFTAQMKMLEKCLLQKLDEAGADYKRNGVNCAPGNISLSFKGHSGEAILHRLDLKKICVSTGSACDSQKTQISHVLQAMGLDEDYALGTIRVSFGRGNTMEDAAAVGDAIVSILRR